MTVLIAKHNIIHRKDILVNFKLLAKKELKLPTKILLNVKK